jgi:small subunit ribosomal protein S21
VVTSRKSACASLAVKQRERLRGGEEVTDAILTSFIKAPARIWLACRACPVSQPEREETLLQVMVRDNNVDQALRVLKKKMQREGVFREMRRHRFYEKPSEQAARKKSDAVRRMRKLARKQAIRDGLIAAPPRKKKEDARRPAVAAGAT